MAIRYQIVSPTTNGSYTLPRDMAATLAMDVAGKSRAEANADD